ncbi:thiamine/thiamine pyrophosphate ABC transporter permease [Paenochrobactrum sp. BZR 588]|uniref:thiamine/thiamine pyrophosphate ABC transporter permease n=1 Tax=unclassified Paenochrobactrum TaxID=2639760 RepID=UPI003854A43F
MRAYSASIIKPLGGSLALAFLCLLAGGALFSLGWQAFGEGSLFSVFDAYVWRITRFTLLQALLSSLLSVAVAIPLARALHASENFYGRALILRLFALPLVLPSLVAILGITAIYGRNGFIAYLADLSGSSFVPNIYGLTGILLAHVFFNMPLAVRLILANLETIPADYWKLSAQLGMGNFSRFRLIEWPVIRRNLSGIAGLIFMLCITSFTTVLTLGGGPRATTLEVAIYQALHFDFDLTRAVALTLMQLILTLTVLVILRFFGRPSEEGFSLKITTKRYDNVKKTERFFNYTVILTGFLFIASPVIGIVASSFMADFSRLLSEAAVWNAIFTSLWLGASSACLSVFLSFALVIAREYSASLSRNSKPPATTRFYQSALETGSSLILVVPPIILGAGWFILLRNFGNPFSFAAAMVIIVNAAMAMPFAVRFIRPAWDNAAAGHNRLCAQLGISGISRLRLIDWPVMRQPAIIAFAFAFALSLGDLGTIALFGSDALTTLPYLLLQRMGSYRTLDAAGLALILGSLCLLLMMIADRAAKARPYQKAD